MPPKRPPPTTRKPAVGTGRATAGSKPGPSRPGQPGRGATVKKTSATKTGAKGKAATKPAEKKGPTKEDLAAIVIQKYVRRFLAIVTLKKLKAKKIEYEDLIEKLQHQAYIGRYRNLF